MRTRIWKTMSSVFVSTGVCTTHTHTHTHRDTFNMDFGQVAKSLQTPPITGWNKQLIWRGTISAFVGMFLGMITSLIVNVALVEISISPFFAMVSNMSNTRYTSPYQYFGALFILIGGVIAWRVSTCPITDEEHKSRQKVFFMLSLMVSASGLLCCTIQRHWFFVLPRILKIPIYSLLGISISFALIFSTIDLMNVGFSLCQLNSARSPVDSAVQVSLIVGAALLMGCIFGFIFGILDVANEISYHVRLSLLREEQFCYPIGGFIGALVSAALLSNKRGVYYRLALLMNIFGIRRRVIYI
eukprot:Blabericola_migrator_1__5315@NODE_2727_length_2416_cov_377_103874_g1708_i0_p1_GENE_NODE_2727_length_2416_cov_377_103874_g1708_i0NODE_2727_length_2416_cov_377_103874_g1708_i0_p1_ORF_typecomplete_len300_score28_53DUF872/PF05915_12/1_1DUF872/PF05915_12/1_3e03DUF2407_C/PF13373_6/2_6e02DUF2407_C/PF13373_6/2_2e03DUF2407_C/PF13373_6/8_3_NODE_2727_length_2416_cov_377_103874_g1708_i010831982